MNEPLSQTKLIAEAVEQLIRLNQRETAQWTPSPDYTHLLEKIAAKEIVIPASAEPIIFDLSPVVKQLERLAVKETPINPVLLPVIDYRPVLGQICQQLERLNAKEMIITLPPPQQVQLTVKQESSLEWLWNRIKEVFHVRHRD